jgi:group II intron reverse transcriptase/maturase
VEPVFEATFQDCSYGFRPKRSAADAVQIVKEHLVRGWWVVDADIQGYFDNIDHDLLLALVGRRVCDRRITKLLRLWLKAGVIEEGQWHPSETGTPQGGVISPLLANIYLHVLDRIWATRHHMLGKLIRYADDFVVICKKKHLAKQALEVIRQVMDRLCLTLSPTKTRLVDMGSGGFDFLGFHFRKARAKKTGKLAPLVWPGQKAMRSVRSRIRRLSDRSQQRVALSDVVAQLNPVIRGWRNYFRNGNSTKKLQDLDRYVRLRLWGAARLRKGLKGCLTLPSFIHWHRQSGIEHFYRTGICGA